MLKIKTLNNLRPFKSANIGDLFEYDGNYYIKTETADYPGGCPIQVNAVNLKNGKLVRFLLDNKIYLLDAEMIVTRERGE